MKSFKNILAAFAVGALLLLPVIAPVYQASAAVLMTAPKIQLFDSNGDPLAGGKVYTYSAGTDTPKDTYTNAGGGTANANPVVLDASGRADIWLSGAYKIVVKDSTDATISTTDNVTAFQTGSGNTVTDSTFIIQDNSDTTKQAQFQVSGVSSGVTRTYTLPDANATLLSTGSAVTVAQGGTGLATLTANNVILGNGTSTPSFVAPSTSGNLLTSNGTTWQSTAPPSGLTTIASGNLATGSPTVVDITSIPATYKSLVLYIYNASNSVATRGLTIEIDAGLGLPSTSQRVNFHQIAGTTVTAVAAGQQIAWTTVTQTAAQATHVYLEIPAYQSGPVKFYHGKAKTAATASDWSSGTQTSFWGDLHNGSDASPLTGAVVGIRITWETVSTGVFDGGTYALYGVK
jgi:hypothetical protein